MPASSAEPAVSIILPTYNRAKFLPQAFDSIRSQTFTDWELIVVDDGSTDNTRELVEELTRGWPQPVRYVYQENRGPYGARNTGLDLARGEYLAFFDSDDLWLPRHLRDCVAALVANPDVGWVFAACRVVEWTTQRTLCDNTFYEEGRPRPFMKLRNRGAGALRIVEDPEACRCMLLYGFPCGLQNSLIRARALGHMRFQSAYRNEAEDRVVLVRMLKRGCTFGYLDAVHVQYNVHDGHSSAAGAAGELGKRLQIQENLIRGYEDLLSEVSLTRRESGALRKRLGREYFWHLGYALLWLNNRRQEALVALGQGLRLWPWNLLYWKTFAVAELRCWLEKKTATPRARPSPAPANLPASSDTKTCSNG